MHRFMAPGITKKTNGAQAENLGYNVICFEHNTGFISYYVLRDNLKKLVRGKLMADLHTRHEPSYFHGSDGKDRPGFTFRHFHNHMEYDGDPTLQDYENLFSEIEKREATISPGLKQSIRDFFNEKSDDRR